LHFRLQRIATAVDGKVVTLPRPVKAGDTVMTQKRCHRGEFRLRPDPEVVQTYWYVLGYCEGKYEVEVTIHRPKGLFPGLSDRAARAKVRELAKAKQADLIAKAREEGRTFMGMKRVLRQPRHTRPSTHLERRGIRPNVAGRRRQGQPVP
jgi:hypothetical protein